jgi:hypothetical protein
MKMRDQPCHCNGHRQLSDGGRENFYQEHFIPEGWKLSYATLFEGMELYLTGYCRDCYGYLEEQIPLPDGLAEDDALQAIYDAMQSAHPYDEVIEHLGYFGKCKARSAFYQNRDAMPAAMRGKLFLDLFHDYDRARARRWLEEHYPTQSHEEVFRDTGGDLFSTVVRLARENGDLDKAKAILDYVLPCKHETGCHEGTELTAYEFDFVPMINFGGSEGIYLDCSLVGKFDGSGRSTLRIGSLKTLDTSLDACKIMGELGGTLMYYANRYVNQNIHRYTPDRELQAEVKRMREKGGAAT